MKELAGVGHLARSDKLLQIHVLLCGSPPLWGFFVGGWDRIRDDKVSWIPSKTQQSHLEATWNSLRVHHPKLTWPRLVWFAAAIPKHSFILWLVMLDRLSTKVGQHKHTFTIYPTYLFCDLDEDRGHLFFECAVSLRVWRSIFGYIGKQGHALVNWDQLALWGKALKKAKIAFPNCVYQIWAKRNSRLHTQVAHSHEEVINLIMQEIKNRIYSMLDSIKYVKVRIYSQHGADI